MLKWVLLLAMLLPLSARADDEVDLLAPVIEPQKVTAQENTQILPNCDDESMLLQVNSLLQEYNEIHPAHSIYAKRQQVLQMRSAQTYHEQKASSFTSSDNRLIADKLLMTKINQGLKDKEIRVCVSQIKNQSLKPVYLLIYPNKLGQTELHIINYAQDPQADLNTILSE